MGIASSKTISAKEVRAMAPLTLWKEKRS